ncbi:hypothetical protein D3C80_1802880 [compost metagenome]
MRKMSKICIAVLIIEADCSRMHMILCLSGYAFRGTNSRDSKLLKGEYDIALARAARQVALSQQLLIGGIDCVFTNLQMECELPD